MSIEELFKKMNKTGEQQSDGSYVVPIENSNDFARTYTILDNLEDSYVTVSMVEDATSCEFIYDDYKIILAGDLDEDKYSLKIEELK